MSVRSSLTRSFLTRWSVTTAAVVALIAFAAHHARAAEAIDFKQGHPVQGSTGVTRTMRDIQREEALRGSDKVVATAERENEHEFRKSPGLPSQPGGPASASIPPMPVDQMIYHPKSIGVHAMSPQTVGLNFTGATLSGTNSTGAFPPDNDGAVGPTQYIIAVNGRIVSFNKTTGVADGVMNVTTNSFFTSVRSGSGTSDPQIRYDRLSGRWFVDMINVSTPNRWMLAVSDSASHGTITAGTVWTYFFFIPATTTPTISNGSTCLSDYPTMAVDANAIYTGLDEFCGTGQPFQQTDVFVIRKSSVLFGGPIVVTAFRALMTATGGYVGPYADRGVDNNDPSSNEGYFIGPDGASWGGMWINRIANPGGTPSISSNIAVTIPIEYGPRPVVHPSNTGGYWGYLDALDDRYFQATMKNGTMWTAHNIGVTNTGVSDTASATAYVNNTRTAARWFQLNVPVNSGTPTVLQSGTVFTSSANNDSLQKNYFIPSLTVSGQNHVAMGFSTAGASNFVNASVVGRLATDPAGTMQSETALTTNSSFTYNPASDPGGISAGRPRRWGDFTTTTLDPNDDQSIWTVQQFVDANNSYACRIAKLVAPGPATPSAMPDVQAGQASVAVTLTGTSASGTGFYDPGSDLPYPARPFSHLSAAVTTGGASGTPPTVISASYTDPTHIQVTLNTSAATANLTGQKYTITITNPDGQTAAAAVVHVTAANFTILATAGTGGAIAPPGTTTLSPGANQTYTITPDGCHTIAAVTVDGVGQGAVASYTFTNVQANHTITASFTVNVETIVASAGANGSISPNGNVSVNCGSNQSFTITPAACYHVADVQVDGGSVGAVSSYSFTNVTVNHTIAASFALGVPPPGPVTGLTATQVKSGNDGSGRTKVTLTYTTPGGASSVEVWRKGFGSYPLYATPPGTGAAPSLPGSYPPAGWTLTSVGASGQTDQPATRDVWYYVAYAKDACSNASAVSNMAGGVLDYHLGDVSDGVTPGQGNNTVNTADASLLGANYGATGGSLSGLEYLDVGPTIDGTTNGRPTPDGSVDFEDLVMFALNFAPHVSIVDKGGPAAKAGADVLGADGQSLVSAGEDFDVPVNLTGAGDLAAISVTLGWNAAIAKPTGVTTGDLVAAQGGLMFSPGAGRADAALFGGATMGGTGAVAVMHFHAVASGAPAVSITHVAGRDGANHDVTVTIRNPIATAALVTSTQLFPVIPNPMRGSANVSYSLARRGPVDVSVYSVDGRKVKTLAHGTQEVGRYQIAWDGTDQHGSLAKASMFFVRLEAAGVRQTRVLSVMR